MQNLFAAQDPIPHCESLRQRADNLWRGTNSISVNKPRARLLYAASAMLGCRAAVGRCAELGVSAEERAIVMKSIENRKYTITEESDAMVDPDPDLSRMIASRSDKPDFDTAFQIYSEEVARGIESCEQVGARHLVLLPPSGYISDNNNNDNGNSITDRFRSGTRAESFAAGRYVLPEVGAYYDATRRRELPTVVQFLSDMQLYMGRCYLYGRGIPENFQEAVNWFRQAAERGSATAIYALGWCFEHGNGLKKNPGEAVRLYKLAGISGDCDALYMAGWCLQHGRGVDVDLTSAFGLFKRGADIGDRDCLYALARAYQNGNGVEQDEDEAIRYFRMSVERGDPDAPWALGQLLHSRHRRLTGQEQDASDLVEAAVLFKLAGDRGNERAFNSLAICYENGSGVVASQDDANKFFKLASDAGNHAAKYNLALNYMDGLGFDADMAMASKLFRESARGGFASALNRLGLHRRDGLCGEEEDKEDALLLFKRAALGGHSNAAFHLASLLSSQQCPSGRDDTAAASWLAASCALDDDDDSKELMQKLQDDSAELMQTIVLGSEHVNQQILLGVSCSLALEPEEGGNIVHAVVRALTPEPSLADEFISVLNILYRVPEFDEMLEHRDKTLARPFELLSPSADARGRSMLSATRSTRAACLIWCGEQLRDQIQTAFENGRTLPRALRNGLGNIPLDLLQICVAPLVATSPIRRHIRPRTAAQCAQLLTSLAERPGSVASPLIGPVSTKKRDW